MKIEGDGIKSKRRWPLKTSRNENELYLIQQIPSIERKKKVDNFISFFGF